jgi:hypothetical protein
MSLIAQLVSLRKANVVTVPLPGGIYVRLWLGSTLCGLPKLRKFKGKQDG